MAGNTDRFTKRLEADMRRASDALDFERAARLRDDLGAMRRALEKNAVVLSDGTDADVIGFAEDDLELAVQIFHVRGGRIRGQRGWVADKVDDADTAGHVEAALLQLYGNAESTGDPIADAAARRDLVPKEILVPAVPSDPHDVAVLTEWLSGLRGSTVSLRVAQRGDKATLAQTVTRNAEQALVMHKTKRASDLSTRGQALEQITEALGLDEVPLRIECYDISNLQETNVVASMVVFEDGLPRKADYRRFSIRGFEGSYDTAALAETLKRRFARYRHEQEELAAAMAAARTTSDGGDVDGTAGIAALIDPETGRRRRFAYAPGSGGRRRRRAAGRGGAGGDGRDGAPGDSGVRAGQAPGGGVAAGGGRPGDHAAYQRGAVPAPAGAGRGAPVRDHLPPQQAEQVDDDQRPRRGRRARADPPQGPAEVVRLDEATASGFGRRGRRRRRDRSLDGPGRRRRTRGSHAEHPRDQHRDGRDPGMIARGGSRECEELTDADV